MPRLETAMTPYFLARRVGWGRPGFGIRYSARRHRLRAAEKLREGGDWMKRVLLQFEGHENVGHRLNGLGLVGDQDSHVQSGLSAGVRTNGLSPAMIRPLSALGPCVDALLPRGAISIIAYRGHRGGGRGIPCRMELGKEARFVPLPGNALRGRIGHCPGFHLD